MMDEKGWLPGKQGWWRQGLKISPHRLLEAKLLLLVVLIIFPWFSACAKDAQPPKPPIVLPFAVQKAGNKLETEIKVAEHRAYLFHLRFLFNENDERDRARVRKLVGGAGIDKYGNLVEPGIPVALRIRINLIDATGEKLILEKEFFELKLSAHADSYFSKQIIGLPLLPGHYRISIESLMDVPELLGTDIFLIIASDPKTRKIS